MESTFAGKTVLVTGANRGLGQALVEEALRRGAKRVYAGTRQEFSPSDERVVPVALDVTDEDQIQTAVGQVESLDVLINSAGVAIYDNLSDRDVLKRHLAVNLFGPWRVTQAFVPLLTRTNGAVVNVLSTAAAAAVPVIPAYSASKAASWSLSQSLRALGAARHQRSRRDSRSDGYRDVARRPGREGIHRVGRASDLGRRAGRRGRHLPGSDLSNLAESWRTGAVKEMERQNASLVSAEPLAA